MMRILISNFRYHQLFSSHDPGVEVTSELSDPEDSVMVEVDEAREGWEDPTEHEGRGLVTNLWASSSHSNPDIGLFSKQCPLTHFILSHCQLTLIRHFARNVLQTFCLTHFLRTDHMRDKWKQWGKNNHSYFQWGASIFFKQPIGTQTPDHPFSTRIIDLTLMRTAFCFDELLTTKACDSYCTFLFYKIQNLIIKCTNVI